jgi:hypothetical protein
MKNPTETPLFLHDYPAVVWPLTLVRNGAWSSCFLSYRKIEHLSRTILCGPVLIL